MLFPAFGAGVVPVDPATQALDQKIQALKQDVVDIDSRGQGIEQDMLYPAYSRVTVYAGVGVNALLLQSISVSIDDGNAISYDFKEDESRALQDAKRHGLQRLLRANVGIGPHRLKADFTAHYVDSKADAPSIRGHYEAFFTKEATPTELELSVDQGGGFRSDPALKLRDWKAVP